MNTLGLVVAALLTQSADIQVTSQREQNGARVSEVTYAIDGGRVAATIVEPLVKNGRLGGVVYAHGAPSAGQTYANEALVLSSRGTVSVIVTLPSDQAVRVSAVQKALDLAIARGAAPARLAYVGSGEGRALAVAVASADPRIKSYVLYGGATDAASPQVTALLVQDGKADADARKERLAFLTTQLKPH